MLRMRSDLSLCWGVLCEEKAFLSLTFLVDLAEICDLEMCEGSTDCHRFVVEFWGPHQEP